MSIWEQQKEIHALQNSEVIGRAYAGQLAQLERDELEDALLGKYNLSVKKLRPETDPIYADIEGGRSAIINQMLGLGTELLDPFAAEKSKITRYIPSTSPTGGPGITTTDIQEKEIKLKKLMRDYGFNTQDYLEEQGVDTSGLPRSLLIPDTGLTREDPQLLLSRLPAHADQMYATRKVITNIIKDELPDFTESQLELFRDPVTNTLIFKNPLNNNKPTTVPTLNQGKGQDVLDWFRKEGPELMTIISTGIAGTVGGLGIAGWAPSPATKLKGTKMAIQNLIGPITGGALGDSIGQLIWDISSMTDLRSRGLLDPEQWTNDAIWKEAGGNAARTGGFSLGSAAVFNVALKAMGVKGVWSGDFDEAAVHSALKKGLASESSGIDPAGIGFWDKGSALRFLKRKIEAEQIPDTMRAAFPGFPGKISWTDKYFTMSSEEAMSLARNLVAHETGDPTILLGKTLPQMIRMAQQKGILTAEDSVAIANLSEFQTILHALRDQGNAQARRMIDDVLRPQEIYLMNQYADKLFKNTGINIQKLREGFGEKFYQGFGELVEKEIGATITPIVQRAAANVDGLTRQMEDAVNTLGKGEITEQAAGAGMRQDVIEPIRKAAIDEKDRLYAEFYKDAGGKVKKWDVTTVVNEIKAFERGRGKAWTKSKLSSEVRDLFNQLKGTPIKKEQYKGIYKLQSFDDIQGTLTYARGLRETAGKADREALDSLIDTLEGYRFRVLRDVGGDAAANARLAEDMFGEIQDTFNKGVIKRVREAGTDTTVLKRLLFSGNQAEDDLVRKAIFNNPAPEAAESITLVQGWLKGQLLDLGRDIETKRFSKELLKQSDFDKFYLKNEALIKEFFEPKEARLFESLPKIRNALLKETQSYDRMLIKFRNDKTLKSLGLNFDEVNGVMLARNPEWFFNNIWKKEANIRGITPIEKFIKAIPDSKAGNDVVKNLKIMVAADMDKQITLSGSRLGGGKVPLESWRGGIIDPALLTSYLKESGDSLNALYGKGFKEGLLEYRDMLNYFMPEGGTGRLGTQAGDELLYRMTGQNADMIATVNGLTRAYIGIFTRPGRFLTAGLRGFSKAQEKKALELLLHPDKFMNNYQIREFLKSPIVNTIIRNYGRPIWEKDTTLEEDITEKTKNVARHQLDVYAYNLGGRVSPSLMPLRYGL